MKVFDFDNTLYRGESSIDLSFYMIRHDRRILLYVPTILVSLVRYKLCLMKKDEMERIINDFFGGVMRDTGDPSGFVRSFWETHADRLNRKMLALVGPGDVIMTASPSFLLDGIRTELNTDRILCTEVDPVRKKITWFNFGDNKVRRFRDLYGDRMIDVFYTDSYNDRALMEISRKVYIVRRGVPLLKKQRRRRMRRDRQ